jgi:DNA ligase-1
MRTLPLLFKLTSTGAVQTWSIGVDGNVIVIDHGQQGGKIQHSEETIKEGKNIGRSSETTPEEQALLEATSKWEAKIKKGYVEDLGRAIKGEKDIEGGFDCMLAHKFADHGHKIKYPVYVQSKLNGHRCLAVVKDGVCTLWSRTRKPITSMPHIVKELQSIYPNGHHEIDGELYNHSHKDNFEHLASLIRQEVPAENCTDVEYHVYDKRMDSKFEDRIKALGHDLNIDRFGPELEFIKLVDTYKVSTEEDMMANFDAFLASGYEGAMARNAAGLYVGKRSYDLQKIKSFLDDDWRIDGIEEGRGAYAGCGIFVCRILTAVHPAPCTCTECAFRVKMRGPKERLKDFLDNPKLWEGKKLVVKYQYVSKYGIPIFPVGERFSDK